MLVVDADCCSVCQKWHESIKPRPECQGSLIWGGHCITPEKRRRVKVVRTKREARLTGDARLSLATEETSPDYSVQFRPDRSQQRLEKRVSQLQRDTPLATVGTRYETCWWLGGHPHRAPNS